MQPHLPFSVLWLEHQACGSQYVTCIKLASHNMWLYGIPTGYVRHTTSRIIPSSLNNGTGDYTLGRPVPPAPLEGEEEGAKKRKFPFRR